MSKNKTYTTCKIAGVTIGQRQGILAYVKKFADNAHLYLVREPKNAHDPNAVRVVASVNSNGKQHGVVLGYLPRNEAKRIAPLMDKGKFVTISNYHLVGGGKRADGTKNNLGARVTLGF